MTTDIKICGIRDEKALDAALSDISDDEVRYIGLVFFPKSPRHVDIVTAKKLADHARGLAQVVALTVDPDDALLDEIMAGVAPDVLQLHGKESVERVHDIRQRTRAKIIKAIGVRSVSDVAKASEYNQPNIADLILFDAKPPENADLPGGNGLTFDWRILAGEGQVPEHFMLSGGLSPSNVATAIMLTGATAVDVSSGVEAAPGRKDPALIQSFIQAVKTGRKTTS